MDYRKLTEKCIKNAVKLKEGQVIKPKNRLDENVVYPSGMKERMHHELEEDLKNGRTSLGSEHPAFPEGHEHAFEQVAMGERFQDVADTYKRINGLSEINNHDVITNMMPLVTNSMKLEESHRKQLEDLAVKMIREEFDMDEDVVEIQAKLTENISVDGTIKEKASTPYKMTFENHEELSNANLEVYKRRFVNAMTQGAAKKSNHMFHLAAKEIAALDPRLVNLYSKMMASADYMYYIIPKMEEGIDGGSVRVKFPTKDNPKPIIIAEAMVLPVLIHELVKGVMELLSAHGLPKGELGKFVISKADFLDAEPWDMRLGPALWGRFTDNIDSDDFKLKHHIYSELVALPAKDFHTKMKEILAGTKEGKKIVKQIVDDVKSDMKNEEFDSAMTEIATKAEQMEPTFSWEDLMGNPDGEEGEGFDFESLFGK